MGLSLSGVGAMIQGTTAHEKSWWARRNLPESQMWPVGCSLETPVLIQGSSCHQSTGNHRQERNCETQPSGEAGESMEGTNGSEEAIVALSPSQQINRKKIRI